MQLLLAYVVKAYNLLPVILYKPVFSLVIWLWFDRAVIKVEELFLYRGDN